MAPHTRGKRGIGRGAKLLLGRRSVDWCNDEVVSSEDVTMNTEVGGCVYFVQPCDG